MNFINTDTQLPKKETCSMNAHKTPTLGMKKTTQLLMGLSLAAGMMLTPAAMAAGPAPVDLGSTGHFTILAGATVTTTGGGIINGDVGASPIAGSAILLTQAQVNGTIYAVDASGPAGSVVDPGLLTTAKGDLTIAYIDARDRTPVPTGDFLNPGAGNLGGLNLVPGLYKFTSTAYITGSDVTLTGGPDDVWIFQIATDLIVGNGQKVILAGGARAKNIFWQVGTSATIGTTAVFKGTILADQAIVMKTGSTMEGRALAFEAEVTFNGTSGSLPNMPVAVNDVAATLENTPTTIHVLANDVVTDGNPLTISEVSIPLHGTAVISLDGLTIRYTPDTDFLGVDTFSYTASDGLGGTSSATVTVTVFDERVAQGATFDLLPDEVGLGLFMAKPKVYVTYFDPIKDPDQKKLKKATAKVLTKIDRKLGTASITCEWTKKIKLYSPKEFKASEAAGIGAAEWITEVNQRNLVLNLRLASKEIDPRDQPVRPLALAVPVIADIVPGVPDLKGNATLLITGQWLGTKKPKVWREYTVPGKELGAEKVKRQAMKVVKATVDNTDCLDSKNKPAYMDSTSRDSQVTVVIPAKDPKGTLNGTIVIENGVGLAAHVLAP
jgi:hypothetical protein